MNEVKFKANKAEVETISGQIQEATAALDTTDATAGQVLKVETPGEAPVWGEAGGGAPESMPTYLGRVYVGSISPAIPAGSLYADKTASQTISPTHYDINNNDVHVFAVASSQILPYSSGQTPTCGVSIRNVQLSKNAYGNYLLTVTYTYYRVLDSDTTAAANAGGFYIYVFAVQRSVQ